MMPSTPNHSGKVGQAHNRTGAPCGVFPCRGDDEWIAVEVVDDYQWFRLAALISEDWTAEPGLKRVEGRLGQQEDLESRLAKWTSAFDASSLAQRLNEAGIPAAQVATAADLVADPHLNARGFFVTLDHPDVGPKPYPGSPVHVDGRRHQNWKSAPTLGEHNHDVLERLLGRTLEEIAALEDGRVIADHPPEA